MSFQKDTKGAHISTYERKKSELYSMCTVQQQRAFLHFREVKLRYRTGPHGDAKKKKKTKPTAC